MFRKQEWDSEDGRVQVIPPRKPQPVEIPPKNPIVIEAEAVPALDPSPTAPSPAQADQAEARQDNTKLAAKVPGYVANVAVTDNTRVHAGDVIATIDDGDYRLAAESARNKVTTQEATIARIGHQIEAQNAAVEQAKAQLSSAQAMATRTQLELDRQNKLAAQEFASHQTQEQA